MQKQRWLHRLRVSVVDKPSYAGFLIVASVSLLFGFWLTGNGTHFWDDILRYRHSLAILSAYGLIDGFSIPANQYAVLWELFLGIQTEYFWPFLRAPYWVRHAWNVCFYITSLYALYALLLKVGYRKPVAVLGVALIFGIIRIGGHALFNTKDVPAAMVYLLATIALWLFIKRIIAGDTRTRTLVGIGIISVLPYLVRIPLLLHTVLLAAFLTAWVCIGDTRLKLIHRIRLWLLPLVTAYGTVLLFSPRWWEQGLGDAVATSQDFANVEWPEPVNVLGTSLQADALPWWYALPWPAVHMQPIALSLMLVGIVFLYTRRSAKTPGLILKTRFLNVHLSFPLWVGGIFALSWLAIVIAEPTLYDEERHILFLYPVLVAFGATGLAHLSTSWQYGLAALCTVASLFSYSQWNVYSYVYSSPLARAFGYELQIGDYNGVCMNKAITVLPDYVSRDAVIYAYPIQLATMQDLHLRYRRFFRQLDFPHYTFLREPIPATNAAVVAHRSTADAMDLPGMRNLELETAWSDHLPTGEITCSVLRSR